MSTTLLVVEDSPVIGALVKKVVARHSTSEATLLNAGNGKEGFELLREHRPQLVVLDWMMPDYGGKYFLQQQAGDPELAKIPVIIHSALPEAQIKVDIGGFDAVKVYLQKPVPPSELFAKMQPYMG